MSESTTTGTTDALAPAPQPFQVDLRGVVELLGRHIYSGPRVYLRELLQNGRDAVRARALELGGDAQAHGIRVRPAGPGGTFVVEDDGIGLTADEVAELLATVGATSKRDVLDLPRDGMLGRFGIGLLSCFMVTDRIVVRSRSARGGAPVEWVGGADGTFTVRVLDDADVPVGTQVLLGVPRHDAALLGFDGALGLARTFARHLDVPVRVARPDGRWERVDEPAVFALTGAARRDHAAALRDLGTDLLGAEPFDEIELDVPGTATRGTAFVLPYAPAPGARAAHVVHLGGMLLDPRCDVLLPDWAFFVRAVVDTTGLHPTASREALVDDDALEVTREALGAAVRAWLLQLGATRPTRLAELVAVHHLALKALVVHDDEAAAVLAPWLPLETSAGSLTVGELVRRHPRVRFTETVDEFRQLAPLAPADRPVVNGGYVYDADVVRRLPEVFAGVVVERATIEDALEALDVPRFEDRPAVARLETLAADALREPGCEVVVRTFAPDGVPAIYLADRGVMRALDRGAARGVAPALWGDVLAGAGRAVAGAGPSGTAPRLCLNWSNPLVRTLAATDDETVVSRTVRLLYGQALLAGHRPLRPVDRTTLTGALTDLVLLSAAR